MEDEQLAFHHRSFQLQMLRQIMTMLDLRSRDFRYHARVASIADHYDLDCMPRSVFANAGGLSTRVKASLCGQHPTAASPESA